MLPSAFAAPHGADAGAEGASGRPRRRRTVLRTSLIVLAAVAVVGGAGAAATGVLGGGDGDAAPAASGPADTVAVRRVTLTSSQTVDGTLGYGDVSTVQAPPAAGGSAPGDGGGQPAGQAPQGRPARGAPPASGPAPAPDPAGPPSAGPPGPAPSHTPRPGPSAPSGAPSPSPPASPTGPPDLSGQLAASSQVTASGTPATHDAATATGVLTHLPATGDVIRRGETVYGVDAHDVPLLYGGTPLYRTLEDGAKGDDVAMLERNLHALGYTGFTADDTYTSGTAAAVKAWQHDLKREETGTVQLGDAVVAPGARRVSEVKATLGGALAGDLLTWTGTERMVTVDLDTQYEDLVRKGAKASVKLPDGGTADATVSTVGTVASVPPSAGPGGSGGGSGGDATDATLPVQLTVDDQSELGPFQAAPVDVTLTAETHEDVLAVPVNALLARPGGGYAVQAVTGHGVETRPVTVGLFAGGQVEVSGAGITEGLKVGVPQ